jgi:hypothetical protein
VKAIKNTGRSKKERKKEIQWNYFRAFYKPLNRSGGKVERSFRQVVLPGC